VFPCISVVAGGVAEWTGLFRLIFWHVEGIYWSSDHSAEKLRQQEGISSLCRTEI